MNRRREKIEELACEYAEDAIKAAGPAAHDWEGRSLRPTLPQPADWAAARDELGGLTLDEEEIFEAAWRERMEE